MIIAKFGKPDESRKIDDFLKYIEINMMNYEEEPIPPTLTKDFKTQLKTGAKAKRFLRKIMYIMIKQKLFIIMLILMVK